MEEKIDNILLANFKDGDWQTARKQLLDLFSVSKRHLLESILEDMNGKYTEYHLEVVKNYLDDGC